MVSGGMACVKYLLFLFNLVFAITGLIFIGIGTWILIIYKGYSNFLSMWMFAVPLCMIAVGIVVFFTSFFGCCGAVKEHHCMIITFSVLVLLIFGFEVIAVISSYIMRSRIGSMLEEYMNKTLTDYSTNEDYRRTWDYTQREINCCGIEKPSDWWIRSSFMPNKLPISCCKETLTHEPNNCDSNDIVSHSVGCQPKLLELIKNFSMVLILAGIGVGLVQIVGVLFACCLARSIRCEYQTV